MVHGIDQGDTGEIHNPSVEPGENASHTSHFGNRSDSSVGRFALSRIQK